MGCSSTGDGQTSILSPYFDNDNVILYVYMDDPIIGHLEEPRLALLISSKFMALKYPQTKISPILYIGIQLTLTQGQVN